MTRVGLLCCVLFACSGGSNDQPITAGSDAGPDAGIGIDASPPLQTQYKDARRIVDFTTTGVSCASVCSASEGRCAMDGDTDPEPFSGSDVRDCFGRADYFIPRAHYEDESQNYFPNESLECGQPADPLYTGSFGAEYTLYAVECCCMLEEPHRLANDVQSPASCNEVCAARGLECRAYDLCRQISGLCSDSFPEFFVDSIAHYSEDGDGTGMETYPRCDEVPSTHLLQSHTCMCF